MPDQSKQSRDGRRCSVGFSWRKINPTDSHRDTVDMSYTHLRNLSSFKKRKKERAHARLPYYKNINFSTTPFPIVLETSISLSNEKG